MQTLEDTIQNLHRARREFGRAFDESRHFLLLSYLAQIVSSSVILETHPDLKSDLRDELFTKLPNLEKHINEMSDHLDILGGADGYNDLLTEKAFLDSYRIFEGFIAELFIILGLSSPSILTDDKEHVKIDPDEIFETPSLPVLRRHVIEHEVQALLFGKGIFRGIMALCKKFQISFSISDDDKTQLNLAALLRNVVMHHSSILNTATLRQARRLNVDLPLESGQSIRNFVRTKQPALRDTLGNLAVALYSAIMAKLRAQSLT